MQVMDKKHINKFIEGQLSETERKDTVDQIHIYNNQFKMKGSEKFNADKAWDTFAERIKSTDVQKGKDISIRLSQTLKYAASVILIVGISFFTYYFVTSDKTVEIAAKSEIIEHTLPDGSVVTLNNESALSYSKNFKGNTRNVQFSGEAYFDIAKDPNKPFVIHANGSEIKVLGTEFNVRIKSAHTEVTVTEGKVSLTDNSDKESIILIAGEKGEIHNGTVIRSKNNDRNFLSWKTKELYFEQGEILKDVISDLERTYKVNIEFSDDIGSRMISKHEFTEKDTLDFILDLFGTLHDFSYKKENDKIILIQKAE